MITSQFQWGNLILVPKKTLGQPLGMLSIEKGMQRILDQVWDGQKFILTHRFSKEGVADWYIYDLADRTKRYLTQLSLFIPNNLIHPVPFMMITPQLISKWQVKLLTITWSRSFEIPKLNLDLGSFNSLAAAKILYVTPEPPTEIDIVVAYFKTDLSWIFEMLSHLD